MMFIYYNDLSFDYYPIIVINKYQVAYCNYLNIIQ